MQVGATHRPQSARATLTHQLLDFAVILLRCDLVDVGEARLGGHLVAMLVRLLLMQILQLLQLLHVSLVALFEDAQFLFQSSDFGFCSAAFFRLVLDLGKREENNDVDFNFDDDAP